jgi:hypothetical protein
MKHAEQMETCKRISAILYNRNGRVFAIFLTTFFLNSCIGGYSSETLYALQCSGENRTELEKTLIHFAQSPTDSLKLRAAEFLIGNMPGHYSLRDAAIEKHIEEKYHSLPLFITNTLLCGAQLTSHLNESAKVEDVSIITADFLIGHINRSFQRWHSVPWGKEIPFDVFCEYMLPYRMGCEPLERIMKDSAMLLADSLLALLNNCDISLCEIRQNSLYLLPKSLSISPLYASLMRDIYNCVNISYKDLAICRKRGVPAYVDFTPHWSRRNGRHFWQGSIDPYTHKTAIADPFVRTAKVYRETFSRSAIPIHDDANYVPEVFTSPFNKDVTDEYFTTFDVPVALAKGVKTKYAYLAVFNDLKWQPVAWSRVKGGRATFTKMGGGAAYLPVCYKHDKEVSCGYPFTVDAHGSVKQLKPDVSAPQTLHLTRKNNLTLEKLLWCEALVGLTIKGANAMKDFEHAETLYAVDKPCYEALYRHRIDSVSAYRYYRVSLPPNQNFAMAELCFYDSARQRLIPKAVFADRQAAPVAIDGKAEVWNALDGNYLTFIVHRNNNRHMIFDFGITPVRVAEIQCAPRNDENYVYPGNLYELLYRDEHGWVSMGKKKAAGHFVAYDSVPSGALYWLHNHTKGKEERIFTYENGLATFW